MAEEKQFTRNINIRIPYDMFLKIAESCKLFNMNITDVVFMALAEYYTPKQEDEFSIDATDKAFLKTIAKKMTERQGFPVTPSMVLKNYIERVEMERGKMPYVCEPIDVKKAYGKDFDEVLKELKATKKYLL